MADEHADDVSAAGAAYLVNVLPSLLKLQAKDRYAAFKQIFEAALAAYRKGSEGWGIPEPSQN